MNRPVMLSFVNDYCECAHENILRRIAEENYQKKPGYGTDEICKSAAERIRREASCPGAEIFFLAGGTQTNQVVIDTMLASYEGVLACGTGHVNVHEAGAIEFSGHKVLTLPEHNGKIDAEEAEEYVSAFYGDANHEHMVFPGMIYISHPTEYGTLYSKAELTALRNVCDRHGMKLYLDGARLAYALACPENDLTLADIAALTDVFYIGGTKCGALFGEAVVFTKGNKPAHFVARVKQHGALIAKGWLLGIQFDELFKDGLYLKNGKNAIDRASEIKKVLVAKGYRFLKESPTNQLIIVLDDERKEELARSVKLDFWEKVDDTHTAMRICTSWATTREDTDALIRLL